MGSSELDLQIEDIEAGTLYTSELVVDGVTIPVIVLKGSKDGPTVGVTAGIHGSEYNATCTAFTLIERISPEDLKGALIVFPLVNVPAFENRSVYTCPLDEKNLNRVFPGNVTGSISDKIAFTLFNFLTDRCQYIVDLHCGDLIEDLCAYASYKKTGDTRTDATLEKMATLMDLGAVMSSEGDGDIQGTLAEEATNVGVPSIVAECGGRGIVDEQCVEKLYRGVRNVLVYLDMISGELPEIKKSKKFHNFSILNSHNNGFLLPLKKVGDTVGKDESIAIVKDYWGNIQERIRSSTEGKILLITGPPIQKGEMAAVLLV